MTALLTAIVIATAPTARAAPQPHVQVETRQAIPRKWLTVADCESNRRWHIDNGNGYSGGLQFVASTWNAFAPEHYPDRASHASPLQQVEVAERVLGVQGWGAWPVCSRKAGVR